MITDPGPSKFSVSISLNNLPGVAWGNSRVANGKEVLEEMCFSKMCCIVDQPKAQGLHTTRIYYFP